MVSINSHWIRTTTIEPAPHVALAPVQLVFEVSRPLAQGWSVTANEITGQAGPTQTSLSIDIWDATGASWTIQANGISRSDKLIIQRPVGPLGGALGAFTIPVLPVTIIYAPPVDSLKTSTATYTQGQTVGQTTDLSTSTDQSQTTPMNLLPITLLPTLLGDAAGVFTQDSQNLKFSTTEKAMAGLEANLFDKAAAQIGQLNASETDGVTDLNDTQMTVTATTNTVLGTSAHAGGPGRGDVIYFLHNIRHGVGFQRRQIEA